MWNKDELLKIEKHKKQWEDTTLKKSLEDSPEILHQEFSEIFKQRVYSPVDMTDFNYLTDIGFPGDYPYTRGIHPNMYRSHLWRMAQYSGYGTPEETNQRFKFLLSQGQRGVSLACDLPTQLGLDSDDPLAEADVGVVGVACPSLREAEVIFEGIPLDEITISGSINQPNMILWSMYMALAEKQGILSNRLQGTVSINCLQEYIARNTYIFPPNHAMRLNLDLVEYCLGHIPKLNYLISAHAIREAGSTLVQEGAFAIASAVAILKAAQVRGIDVDDLAPRLSFNFSIQMGLFDEIAKCRALRRLWARIMKEAFGARKPVSLQFRFGPGTSGTALTAQEPENNIIRVTIEALAAILGGAQYLHTSSFDEGYSIPSAKAAAIALRTQQILACESGITDVVDPLGGSYYIESLTSVIEKQVTDYLKKIEARGGMAEVVENGWAQQVIAHSAYLKQKDIEEGKRIIVGVNRFVSKERAAFEVHRAMPAIAEEMKQRLVRLRQERDNNAVKQCLAKIYNMAQGKENLVPFVLEAVKKYATVGEICGILRDAFGEFRPPLTKRIAESDNI